MFYLLVRSYQELEVCHPEYVNEALEPTSQNIQ